MSLQYCGILPYLSSFCLPRMFYYSQHGTSSSSLQRCGAHSPPCFSFRSLCCTLPSISSTQPPLLRFIILCKFIGMCIKTIWTEGQITSTLWAKCILATWYSKSNFPPIHCVSTWIRFHQESFLRTNYPLRSSPKLFWPCVLKWRVTWMKMYISV